MVLYMHQTFREGTDMETEHKTSEARRRANTKWQKNNVDQLKVMARKEEGAELRRYATEHGMGITEFFITAAKEYMANHD